MTENELLALKFGGRTVAENIQRAVDAGYLVREADSRIALPVGPPQVNWAYVRKAPRLHCQ